MESDRARTHARARVRELLRAGALVHKRDALHVRKEHGNVEAEKGAQQWVEHPAVPWHGRDRVRVRAEAETAHRAILRSLRNFFAGCATAIAVQANLGAVKKAPSDARCELRTPARTTRCRRLGATVRGASARQSWPTATISTRTSQQRTSPIAAVASATSVRPLPACCSWSPRCSSRCTSRSCTTGLLSSQRRCCARHHQR